MAWIRVDDQFDEHPKFAKAGPLGMALWLAGLAYSNRNLTDGFIPWSKARSLLSWEFLGDDQEIYTINVAAGEDIEEVTGRFVCGLLVKAELWEVVEGGYQIHDYLDYQPSRAEVDHDRSHIREVRQAAGRAGGLAKAKQTPSKSVANGVAPGYQDASTESGNDLANARQKRSPKPNPKPNPNKEDQELTPPSTTSTAPPVVEFSKDERELMSRVGTALAAFGFRLEPRLWRRVLDGYQGIDLEVEAFKQADWLRRHKVKTCAATRYTNWLEKAKGDLGHGHADVSAEDESPQLVPEYDPGDDWVKCPSCGTGLKRWYLEAHGSCGQPACSAQLAATQRLQVVSA